MMAIAVSSGKHRELFYNFPDSVYGGNRCHRRTEETLTHLLVDGPTIFHSHAVVRPYLLEENGSTVGRFALVHDRRLADAVQVAFFEALPGLNGVVDILASSARAMNTGARSLVIGLNGHLNYGAGFLLNHFDEPPVFGLPYTPSYYAGYFSGLRCRESVSYRFPLPPICAWAQKANETLDMRGVTVRFLNKKQLRKDIATYTRIDNATFSTAAVPYWSNRDPEENYELFYPFRFLLREHHLVFAEKDGEPIGFVLWYADFNQLVPHTRDLNFFDVLRYKLTDPVKTIRLAEIAVVPQYRRLPVSAAILIKSLLLVGREGYETCEGGFIFSDNRDSIAMTERYIERGHGFKMEPYRKYGIYEMGL
jgi:GNAT superfamily N-acetyltransferase